MSKLKTFVVPICASYDSDFRISQIDYLIPLVNTEKGCIHFARLKDGSAHVFESEMIGKIGEKHTHVNGVGFRGTGSKFEIPKEVEYNVKYELGIPQELKLDDVEEMIALPPHLGLWWAAINKMVPLLPKPVVYIARGQKILIWRAGSAELKILLMSNNNIKWQYFDKGKQTESGTCLDYLVGGSLNESLEKILAMEINSLNSYEKIFDPSSDPVSSYYKWKGVTCGTIVPIAKITGEKHSTVVFSYDGSIYYDCVRLDYPVKFLLGQEINITECTRGKTSVVQPIDIEKVPNVKGVSYFIEWNGTPAGIPSGRIVEISGVPDSVKSTAFIEKPSEGKTWEITDIPNWRAISSDKAYFLGLYYKDYSACILNGYEISSHTDAFNAIRAADTVSRTVVIDSPNFRDCVIELLNCGFINDESFLNVLSKKSEAVDINRFLEQYELYLKYAGKEVWAAISKCPIKDEFIIEYAEKLDWSQKEIYTYIEENTLSHFSNKVDWKALRQVRSSFSYDFIYSHFYDLFNDEVALHGDTRQRLEEMSHQYLITMMYDSEAASKGKFNLSDIELEDVVKECFTTVKWKVVTRYLGWSLSIENDEWKVCFGNQFIFSIPPTSRDGQSSWLEFDRLRLLRAVNTVSKTFDVRYATFLFYVKDLLRGFADDDEFLNELANHKTGSQHSDFLAKNCGYLIYAGKEVWTEISKSPLLDRFINMHAHKLDWSQNGLYTNIQESTLRNYEHKIDWKALRKARYFLSYDFINHYFDKLFEDEIKTYGKPNDEKLKNIIAYSNFDVGYVHKQCFPSDFYSKEVEANKHLDVTVGDIPSDAIEFKVLGISEPIQEVVPSNGIKEILTEAAYRTLSKKVCKTVKDQITQTMAESSSLKSIIDTEYGTAMVMSLVSIFVKHEVLSKELKTGAVEIVLDNAIFDIFNGLFSSGKEVKKLMECLPEMSSATAVMGTIGS